MRLRALLTWLSPVLLATVLSGFLLARTMDAKEHRVFWSDDVVEQMMALVSREYVDEIDEQQARELFYSAMDGYLKALDPYCCFYDPEARREMEEDTSGQFGGVGVLVRMRDAGLTVLGVRRGDPAEKAGVQLGDVIRKVDGVAIADQPLEETMARIRGKPGSGVVIEFSRGAETLVKTLTRSQVKSDSVVGVRILDLSRGIGYLRVSSFQENTGEDARRALLELKEKGVRSFILDLRGNRGGVVERGAVALVDLFLDDGPIVETRGRGATSRRVYMAVPSDTVCRTEPLVVLVDGNSASAAEVVAGAFQDRRRAVLLGERTYGKFLVQSIHRLSDMDVALQITTARYYTPYGRWLQRRDDDGIRGGLVPDVVVPRTAEDDSRLEELFGGQHGMDMIIVDDPLPEPDGQLERAIELLTDHYAVRGSLGR
jgi:carboxyl-terminal processing protease